MTFPAVEISKLTVRYGPLVVLQGFDLLLAAGESVALMGPSGSGKSSLLSCVTGMLKPSAGEVRIANELISGASLAGRAKFRRSMIGLIQQNPQLLPELTIAENVAVVLFFDGVARAKALAAAEECLSRVGLAGLGAKRIDEVSGGQAQRVALARALARPEIKVIVADEPTAALDADNAQKVTSLLLEQGRAVGAGVILATHDPAVAAHCDRSIQLRQLSTEQVA